MELAFNRIGAVVPGTTLNRCNGGIRNQLQQIACLHADVLYPQVTGNMVGNLAKRGLEIGLEQIMFMPQH